MLNTHHYLLLKLRISAAVAPLPHISLCLECAAYLFIYRGADKSLARPPSRYILFGGENISFDVSLVIYINSNNNPTVMIINRMYEHKIFCLCSLVHSWSG